ncbi:hypothetical protein HMPREF0044_1213 [Gleimia coleocanis DSM 15436]|uniref:Uncharacterized protein n=1 Tax=Gleimia coleocanis DSM 15436 TaxID=525245 RepID=C0W1C3_9ACTO|nr:hypothetical protein HMPREF0044_1213 [Gleimia coleocanis DSM 15436]
MCVFGLSGQIVIREGALAHDYLFPEGELSYAKAPSDVSF